MDWGAVSSDVITGLVGIAGIVGSLVSAKITSNSGARDLKVNIEAENDRAELAEKRRTYAQYLRTVSAVIVAHGAAHDDAYRNVVTAGFAVKMIAPAEIANLAMSLTELLRDDEQGDELPKPVAEATNQVSDAMRADLGILDGHLTPQPATTKPLPR